MAIRFHCAACNQPIEVDDEWALRTVACPYCRKTVTAPAESTLGNLSEIPVASPLDDVQAFPELRQPAYVATETAKHNYWAIAALVLAVLAFLTFLISNVISATHMMDVLEPGMTMKEQIDAIQKFQEENQGNLPGWLAGAVIAVLLSCVAWPAAVICGVVGVFRERQRSLAVIALVICGVQLAFVVCSGLMQLAA
ncbi:MAG: hypothetical protein JSV78_01940 [Phycisphaerales bacterium]|nr:MAG: hypothetical protein JSV78_01940 [Phycisphaerales bacterium]